LDGTSWTIRQSPPCGNLQRHDEICALRKNRNEYNDQNRNGNLTPLKERIEDYHVHWVIDEAPDETSPDEAKQRFQAAGHPLADNLEVTAETEWPEKIRQHVSSPSFNAKISLRSWGNLKPVA
jgi:hypothetical protein